MHYVCLEIVNRLGCWRKHLTFSWTRILTDNLHSRFSLKKKISLTLSRPSSIPRCFSKFSEKKTDHWNKRKFSLETGNLFHTYRKDLMIEDNVLLWMINLRNQNNLFVEGIIHLVHAQNFPKNKHFLPPNRHKYACVLGGTKC